MVNFEILILGNFGGCFNVNGIMKGGVLFEISECIYYTCYFSWQAESTDSQFDISDESMWCNTMPLQEWEGWQLKLQRWWCQ